MRLNRWLFSLFLIICLSQTGLTQADAFGLVFDDAAYINSHFIPKDSIRGGNLPYRLSLRTFCPTPGDQGSMASCVGWALSNALTIAQSISKGINDPYKIDEFRYSVFYIYNQIKLGHCQAGAKLSDGIRLLQDQGDCWASLFDVSTQDCNQQPSVKHRQLASSYAIRGYEALFKSDAPIDDKIDAIRFVIAQKKPVVIGALVPDNFRNSSLNTLNWKQVNSGHAMVVIGYDDGKEEFEMMNSYGVTWGERGFFRLGYEKLASCLKYGYKLY